MIAPAPNAYQQALQQIHLPLHQPVSEELMAIISDARVVMLGEATHGTSEFYTWRREISKALMANHGFKFIAVEGDWPDCRRVHEYIIGLTGRQSADDALAGYRRFPTWMWGNRETLELVRWLREFNEASRGRKAGFHGLDVYSLHDSMRLVIKYLERVDPNAAENTKRAYECFEPFGYDPVRYARATRFVPAGCERQVWAALTHLERLKGLYSTISIDHVDPADAYFDATMNARVTANAEAYYRTMLAGDAPSWNVRDEHMMQTLELLLEHYGPDSRAIVWAHNTHIGDYRATDMLAQGYVNLGGIARVMLGSENVRLIGFGTQRGTVTAARAWGAQPEIMPVPPARPGSLEHHLHELQQPQILLPLRSLEPQLRQTLNQSIGHRAIGVVYHPEREHRNYVPTQLANRYDAFIFIDQTRAVESLNIPANLQEEPEAWPSGL